ncbi:MAG: hypothetical protein F7C36_03545 [Desulfurococcales archaeon]|nr:hypothetical protein [Desulfurococcales archaeon]
MYRQRNRENKAIKEALLGQIPTNNIDLDEIVEWLWEDFGIRAKKDWEQIKKIILREKEITPQDLAVFMIDNDIFPEEGAWDVMPRRGLRGRIADRED